MDSAGYFSSLQGPAGDELPTGTQMAFEPGLLGAGGGACSGSPTPQRPGRNADPDLDGGLEALYADGESDSPSPELSAGCCLRDLNINAARRRIDMAVAAYEEDRSEENVIMGLTGPADSTNNGRSCTEILNYFTTSGGLPKASAGTKPAPPVRSEKLFRIAATYRMGERVLTDNIPFPVVIVRVGEAEALPTIGRTRTYGKECCCHYSRGGRRYKASTNFSLEQLREAIQRKLLPDGPHDEPAEILHVTGGMRTTVDADFIQALNLRTMEKLLSDQNRGSDGQARNLGWDFEASKPKEAARKLTMENLNELDRLNNGINRSALRANRGTPSNCSINAGSNVVGSGHPHSMVLVLGAASTVHSSCNSRPFVGRHSTKTLLKTKGSHSAAASSTQFASAATSSTNFASAAISHFTSSTTGYACSLAKPQDKEIYGPSPDICDPYQPASKFVGHGMSSIPLCRNNEHAYSHNGHGSNGPIMNNNSDTMNDPYHGISDRIANDASIVKERDNILMEHKAIEELVDADTFDRVAAALTNEGNVPGSACIIVEDYPLSAGKKRPRDPSGDVAAGTATCTQAESTQKSNQSVPKTGCDDEDELLLGLSLDEGSAKKANGSDPFACEETDEAARALLQRYSNHSADNIQNECLICGIDLGNVAERRQRLQPAMDSLSVFGSQRSRGGRPALNTIELLSLFADNRIEAVADYDYKDVRKYGVIASFIPPEGDGQSSPGQRIPLRCYYSVFRDGRSEPDSADAVIIGPNGENRFISLGSELRGKGRDGSCELRARLYANKVFIHPVTKEVHRVHARCLHWATQFQKRESTSTEKRERALPNGLVLGDSGASGIRKLLQSASMHPCALCGQPGAQVKCYQPQCSERWHTHCGIVASYNNPYCLGAIRQAISATPILELCSTSTVVGADYRDPYLPRPACRRHSMVNSLAPQSDAERQTRRKKGTYTAEDLLPPRKVGLAWRRGPEGGHKSRRHMFDSNCVERYELRDPDDPCE